MANPKEANIEEKIAEPVASPQDGELSEKDIEKVSGGAGRPTSGAGE